MRRSILVILAALDAWIVLWHGLPSVRQAVRFLWTPGEFPGIVAVTEALRILLVLTLLGSSWLLLCGTRGVRRVTWLALPLRLYFAILGEPQYLSLVFLRSAALAWIPGPPHPLLVLAALAGADFVRALVTLWAAANRSRPTRPLTQAPAGSRVV